VEPILPGVERTELGKISIAPEVIEVIAGLAASEVEGVAAMSGSFVGDIAERLGRRKNFAKGVSVDVGEKEAAVSISIVVRYGYRIPEVAREIQENVRAAIENMTGLTVTEVNVHVVDVQLKDAERDTPEDPRVR